MEMNFHLPVRLFCGENCIQKQAQVFLEYGAHALIVTSPHAGKASGALDDLAIALDAQGIGYTVFDEIEENPKLTTCERAGALARKVGAAFIIGVGGGSPLDAAKAVAVFAANPNLGEGIYELNWNNAALPILLVGTTAGTGSELTAVSVLTTADGLKRSVTHEQLFAKVSFGDARYTMSLSKPVTLSTALDAICHAVEGYFVARATPMSRMFAETALCHLLPALQQIQELGANEISYAQREALYYGSLFAGAGLCLSGVGYCHTIGYHLTERYHQPHGVACAVLLPDFIARAVHRMPQEAAQLFARIGMEGKALSKLVEDNLHMPDIQMTEEEIDEASERWAQNKNFKNSHGGYTQQEAITLSRQLMKGLFCR